MEEEQQLSLPSSSSSNVMVELSFEPLMCEAERMNKTLTTLDADWNLKMEHLYTIQKWLGSGLSEMQYCAQIIDVMKEGISVILEDRRSILCKETCATVTRIASHFGLKFEPLATHFIPTLLKNLVVTIKVISESSHACILSLLPIAPSSLPIILQGITEKHPVLRSRCAEYLSCLLSSSPCDFLVQYLEPSPDFNHTIFSVLVAILTDSSADVRSQGKKCYTVLKKKFANQTQQFYSKLDPSVQKRLADEDKAKPVNNVRDFKKMMLQKKRENSEVESIDVLKPSVAVESETMSGVVNISPPSNPTNLLGEIPQSEPVLVVDEVKSNQENVDRLVGSKSKADFSTTTSPLPLSEIAQKRLSSEYCTRSPAKIITITFSPSNTPPATRQLEEIEPSKKVMKKGKKGKENILEHLSYQPGSTPIAVRVKRRGDRRLIHRD
eukprot:TRINITY_DN13685_c0_g1_i1.p1 TRINITY_DN13685_c0_g1~~TRINITY_DN13685_c0_g1_i1.p1  ORF type:complete len:439 (+),score=101.60 TRINITY_DN13685_c0_g1_i1:176-1492(+)